MIIKNTNTLMKPMESHSWNHGVLTRQRSGTLTITNSIWTLTTDVEIAVYEEIVNRVRRYVRDSENILKKEFRSSHNSTNLANRNTEWEKEVEEKINAENRFLLTRTKQLTKMLKIINDLTSNKPRYWGRRGKRMVVAPFMGTALKFLFGTADNNDVIEIHRHIESLRVTTEKTIHIAELQATMLQTLHNDKLTQEVIISKLINATNSVTSNLNKVKAEAEAHSRLEEYERKRMLNLITNLDIIRETITKAESVVQNLMADISMITMGKIPPHLLPPDVLIEGLEAISEVLPAGNTLLSPTTSGVIWDYYHLTMVKSIVTNDGIRLFIELPIVTPQSTFDLFDIIPFPTQIPETKNFTLMQTKVPLLALSKDHYSYIPLTHNDLISCSPTSSPLCVKSFPVWSTAGAPSCELYVVLNDVTGISEKCDLVLINSKKERLVHIQERVWAYFFPEPITVRFDCVNESVSPKPFILVGTGTFDIPVHCTALAKTFTIKHGIRGNSSLSTELPSFNFPVLNASTFLLPNVNISYLPLLETYPSTSDNSDWLVSTAELEKATRNNQPIFRSIDERMEYWATLNERGAISTSLISTSGLALALVAVAIAMYFCWRRKSPRAVDEAASHRLDELQLEIRNLRSFVLSELSLARDLITRTQQQQ